jgi:hypothetical protein
MYEERHIRIPEHVIKNNEQSNTKRKLMFCFHLEDHRLPDFVFRISDCPLHI